MKFDKTLLKAPPITFKINDMWKYESVLEKAPHLVSPMRSGAHWIRFILELYSGEPGLRKIFYYFDSVKYSHIWEHDPNDRKPESMIFLYRNPVDSVFSQMNFLLHPDDVETEIKDWNIVKDYALSWAMLFEKCVINNNFSKKLTLLKYENFIKDFNPEFKKLYKHLFPKKNMNYAKLEEVKKIVTKGLIRQKVKASKTVSDIKVINEINASFKPDFKRMFGERIKQVISMKNSKIDKFL